MLEVYNSAEQMQCASTVNHITNRTAYKLISESLWVDDLLKSCHQQQSLSKNAHINKQSQLNIMFLMFSNHCTSKGNVRNEQTCMHSIRVLSPTIIIPMSKQSPANPQLSPQTQHSRRWFVFGQLGGCCWVESWAEGTIILEPGDTPRQPAATNRATSQGSRSPNY